MKSAGKLTTILIAAFSLLLVFGALLTALAETGFTANENDPTAETGPSKPTATLIMLPTNEEVPTEETDQPSEQSPTEGNPTDEVEKTKAPTETEKVKETLE